MVLTMAQSYPGNSKTSAANTSLSKVLDDTIKRNERENELLRQQKKQIQNEHILERVIEKHEKIELQKDLLKIPKVKKTAPLSFERVLFLNQHGIRMENTEKFYNINYFMSLIDDLIEQAPDHPVTESRMTTTKSINPTKFPLRLDFNDDSFKKGKEGYINHRGGHHGSQGHTSLNKINGDSHRHHSKKDGESLTNDNHHLTSMMISRDGELHDGISMKHTTVKNASAKKSRTSNDLNTNPSDKKLTKKPSVLLPDTFHSRPRWMFRTIEPPEHGGRYVYKPKSKFITPKTEEIEKQVTDESFRDATKQSSSSVTQNEEDLKWNEAANDYRYKVLARNKLSAFFVTAPTGQKNGESRT